MKARNNFRHNSKSENGHFTGFLHNIHLFLIMCSIYNLHKIAILTPFTYVVHVALNICFSPLTIIRNILIIYSNHLIFIPSLFVYIFLTIYPPVDSFCLKVRSPATSVIFLPLIFDKLVINFYTHLIDSSERMLKRQSDYFQFHLHNKLLFLLSTFILPNPPETKISHILLNPFLELRTMIV